MSAIAEHFANFGEFWAAHGSGLLPWLILFFMLVATWAVSVRAGLSVLSSAAMDTAIADELRFASALTLWRTHPQRVLAVLSLLQHGALLISGAFSALLWLQIPQGKLSGGGLAVIVVSALVLVATVGFCVPETLARHFALTWSRWNLGAVRVFSFLLRPLLWPGWFLLRLFCAATKFEPRSIWSADDIYRSVDELRAEGLDGSGEELLHSILEFSDTLIHEIMVPRIEMVALPLDCSMDEVWTTVTEAGHSRLPIFGESIDDLVGVLHVKDLFSVASPHEDAGDIDLRSILRPLYYVPEVMKISELLREFQRRKTHMAIVVDEYGQTTGVVTLEDVIEEIVGEIQDEYDVEEKQVQRISESRLVADGRVSIDELEAELGVEFPDDAGYESLGGFLTQKAGLLPSKGQVIRWQDLSFTIKEADHRRVITVEIERGPQTLTRPPTA